MLTAITEVEFEEKVLRNPRPVLVDFGAEWCHPCKRLDPLVHELAEEWEDRLDVVAFDVDQSVDITMTYQIMGVPTLMLFINGEVVERMTGFAPKKKLIKLFEPRLAAS